MKKSILFLVPLVLLSIYFFLNPIVIKLIVGSARIIGEEVKSEIVINGKKEPDVKVFACDSDFYGNKRNHLIVCFRDSEQDLGFPVLVIDRETQQVKLPNASTEDYKVILGKLLQSESGANVMIPLNDPIKGFGFEPELQINDQVIRFKIANENKIQTVAIHL